MVESLVNSLKDLLPPEVTVFIISMLPILELRGGLVAAKLLSIDLSVAFPICVLGNMLPIPLELLFIRKIFNLLKKTKLFSPLVKKLDERARKKAESKSFHRRLGLGLFLLVAIPLPGTGAWTGGLVADILDIRFKRSFPIIFAGVITAGIIMSLISYIIIPGLFF